MSDTNGNADINAAIRQAAGRGGQEANPYEGISSEDLQATWLDWREKLGADDSTVKGIAAELSRRSGHGIGGGMDGGARGVEVDDEQDMNAAIRRASGRPVDGRY